VGSWHRCAAQRRLAQDRKQHARGVFLTYRTVQNAVPLVASLFDMTLQGGGIQGLQQFKTTQELAGDGHDSAPVVKFTTILVK